MTSLRIVVMLTLGSACGPRPVVGGEVRLEDGARSGVGSPQTEAGVDAPADANVDADVVLARTSSEAPPPLPEPPASNGAVSGTSFWQGAKPEERPGRRIGIAEARASDWVGPRRAEFWGLEDVIVVAVPVTETGKQRARNARSWPDGDGLRCDHRVCPNYVTLAAGDRLALTNSTASPVEWELVRDGRVVLRVAIDARRFAPAYVDIDGLAAGVYGVRESASGEQVGWVYRSATDELAVGPTRGSLCRFSLSLSPGTYRLVAWHPDLESQEHLVEVKPRRIQRFNPVFSEAQIRP